MVSKSKILGESAIIFVTTGTTKFSFNRIFLALDNVLINTNWQSKLIIQTTVPLYKWRYKKILHYSSLTPNQLISLIKKSDKIIVHGGFGTINLISKYGRSMPFIVARLKQFNEHVNNHQAEYLRFLRNKLPVDYQKYIFITGELEYSLKKFILEKDPKTILKNRMFNNQKRTELMLKLENYLSAYEDTIDS